MGKLEDKPFITVVSGLPRSGTSLMMQMLEAGGIPILSDGRRVPDPDNPRGYYELEAVKSTARDASWTSEAVGRAVKVIHLLIPALPVAEVTYRIIMMRRPIEQVMRSQAKMLLRQNKPGPQNTDAIVSAFAAQMHKAERTISDRADMTSLEVDYPRLMSEPASVIDEIDTFLGCGRLDRFEMASRIDSTLYRNRV